MNRFTCLDRDKMVDAGAVGFLFIAARIEILISTNLDRGHKNKMDIKESNCLCVLLCERR